MSAKNQYRAIQTVSSLWHKRTNVSVKESLYDFNFHHLQVVQSPISNDCLKLSIHSHTKKHLLPKLLFQFSDKELQTLWQVHQKMGVIKEARFPKKHHWWLLPTHHTSTPTYKCVKTLQGCGWVLLFYIFQEYAFLFFNMAWSSTEKLKDQSHNMQNRRSSEIASPVYETYKIQFWNMGVISIKQKQTWPYIKCVIFNLINGIYHIENVCFIFEKNSM